MYKPHVLNVQTPRLKCTNYLTVHLCIDSMKYQLFKANKMQEFVGSANFYTDKEKGIMISKSNTLIEAGFELTLAEHDLLTLAINKLHKQATNNHDVFITAKEFSIANGVSESHAYQLLKSTANILMDRQLKFPLYIDLDKKNNNEPNAVSVIPPKHGRYEAANGKYNWLQGVAYADNQGFIYIHFSDPLRFLIDKTGDAYTNYNYSKTLDMRTFNAKRLYELVCKWKDLGATKSMYIDDWREFFGVPDKYPNIAEFKRRILDPSIKALNEQGDFDITLKQEKVGRIITHFQLLIKSKNKVKNMLDKAMSNRNNKENNIIDLFESVKQPSKFIKMSDTQLDTFSSKLSELHEVQAMAHMGEEMKSFTARLRLILKDPKQQIKLQPYLYQAGFKVK